MYPLQTVNTVHLIQMLQGEKQQTTTTTTKNKALTITVLAEKKNPSHREVCPSTGCLFGCKQ